MNAKKANGSKLNCCDIIAVLLVVVALLQISYQGAFSFMWALIGIGLPIFYLLVRGLAADVVDSIPRQARVPWSRDASSVDRVITENKSGRRHVISGWKDQTFRSACLEAWVFTSVKKKSDWTIIDDKGNDISDTPMSSYEGIARIGFLGPMCEQLVGDEATDYYSDDDRKNNDLERGVEFYD